VRRFDGGLRGLLWLEADLPVDALQICEVGFFSSVPPFVAKPSGVLQCANPNLMQVNNLHSKNKTPVLGHAGPVLGVELN